MKLDGMVAVVTGAGRGIGAGIALSLARCNARVVLVDIDQTLAVETATHICDQGYEAYVVKADVTSKKDISNAIDDVLNKYGAIEILVNNAGIADTTRFEDMAVEEWNRVQDINLRGCFLCSQAVIGHMKDRGFGRIISISSMAGIMGSENVGAAYCSSKAGIIGLTKYLSRNYAYYGITANAIAPGPIGSEMTEKMGGDMYNKLIDSMPMKRLGKPENIGDAVAFLASKEAEFITGTVLEASGGEIIVV